MEASAAKNDLNEPDRCARSIVWRRLTTSIMTRKKKTINDFKHPPFLIKSMLETIEREHGGRDRLNFKDLCDTQQLLFGAQGSQKRQDFQSDWQTIKKRTFKDCVDLLDQLEILPGTNTARLVQRFGDDLDLLGNDNNSAGTNNNDDNSNMTSESKSATTNTENENETKPKTAAPPRPRTTAPPPSLTPVRSPPPRQSSMKTSTTQSSTTQSSKEQDLFDVDDLSFAKLQIAETKKEAPFPDGTETNPFRFAFKDGKYHPFGFFARLKANKKVGTRGRLVLELTKNVGADADFWYAKIATEGKCAYRAINITGPPVDYWILFYLDNLDHDKDDPNSQMDAQAFMTWYNDKNNNNKEIHYQLVIEDEEQYLDNHAISNDDVEIKRVFKRLDAKPSVFKGKQLHSVVAKWEVALFDVGKKKIIGKDNSSASDLF